MKEEQSKDEQSKKELREEIPGLVGDLLKLYGVLFVVGWIILGMTQFMWLTEDTSWLAVFIVALILPFILAALICAWAYMKVDRCDRIVKLLVDTQTENPQIQEADAYLRKLVDQNKLKEQLYDKVREARAACFENGCVLEKMIPEYRQVLYDVDQGFAVKNEFFVVRAESGKMRPVQPAQPILLPVLPQLQEWWEALMYRLMLIWTMMTASLWTWKKPSMMTSCFMAEIPSTGIPAATTWTIPLDSEMMGLVGMEMSGKEVFS